jgi:hypothetical protein
MAAYKKLESTEKPRCSRQSTADPAASGDQQDTNHFLPLLMASALNITGTKWLGRPLLENKLAFRELSD